MSLSVKHHFCQILLKGRLKQTKHTIREGYQLPSWRITECHTEDHKDNGRGGPKRSIQVTAYSIDWKLWMQGDQLRKEYYRSPSVPSLALYL